MSAAWDVVVVGAGPAGSACATTLARLGRRVMLLDDAGRAGFVVGESLPAAAGPILRDLGLAAVLEGHGRTPSRQVSWGSPDVDTLDLIRDPHGLGWHLDRARFDEALRKGAETAGAVRRHARLRALHRLDESAGWRFEDTDGATHETRFVVEATGRRALVARRLAELGEDVQTRDDTPLIALVRWVQRRADDTHQATLVEAVPEGWWYTAPVPGGARVVVLHTLPELVARLTADDPVLERLVTRSRHVAPLIAGTRHLHGLVGRDARGGYLRPFGGPGWLAVGDAALHFDPLSSQGLFHALYTGLRGAQAVAGALDGAPEPGRVFGSVLADVRRTYVANQARYLAMERRWPIAPFWAAQHPGRHATPPG